MRDTEEINVVFVQSVVIFLIPLSHHIRQSLELDVSHSYIKRLKFGTNEK